MNYLEGKDEDIDLYTADVETLARVASQKSVWEEIWELGDGHEGVPLQEWFAKNYDLKNDNALFYKQPGVHQIMWVRDDIRYITGGEVEVISTHVSKSTTLPVYRITNKNFGLRIYLRNNFYNWKMSVDSIVPISENFSGLFQTSPPREDAREHSGNCLAKCYFEGFPKNVIFDYHGASDGRRWSAQLSGDNRLWTTIFLILRSLGHVKPIQALTSRDHVRILNQRTAMGLLKEKDALHLLTDTVVKPSPALDAD